MQTQKLSEVEEVAMQDIEKNIWKPTVVSVELMIVVALLAMIFNIDHNIAGAIALPFAIAPLAIFLAPRLTRLDEATELATMELIEAEVRMSAK